LLLTVLIGRGEAATEWVKLYRSDVRHPEWVEIVTNIGKGQVVAIYDNSFTIDLGRDHGARKDGLYLVYSERVPHRGKEPLAVLKVTQTVENFSLCDMTPYVSGGLIHVGDRVAPVAVSATNEAFCADPLAARRTITVTEGYISQNGPSGNPMPDVYPIPASVIQVEPTLAAYSQPVSYQPVPAQIPAQTVSPVVVYSQPMTNPAQVAYTEPVQYNYQPLTAPLSATPQPMHYQPVHVQAPAPAQSPFPGNVTYPPYPNYQYTGQVQLDFDANKIADARLIRTFPLSQPDMNALEIQFRGAYDLFAAQRYYEAFEAFMRQTNFRGNYMSPYWAGICALRIGDRQTAINLFNNALAINPYYEPARQGLLVANGTTIR